MITRPFRERTLLVALILVSMVLGAVLFAGYHGPARAYAVEQPAAATADKDTLVNTQNAFESVASKVGPAVVYIESERKVEAQKSPMDDFFKNFPGFPGQPDQGGGDSAPRVATASGSGVIVRADGYILTNDHVAGGADRVTVKVKGKGDFKGTVLRDPYSDLAVVKIDAKNLPVAQFADSDKVKVGQWAIALGNPFGLDHSLTVGVVSALTRQFSVPDPDVPSGGRLYPDAIQTDASINPGNSGGPLVDIDGRIIGINAAIYSPSGASVGVGFAIPANTAKSVMEQLISKGKITRGYLGLSPVDIEPEDANRYGVKDGALVAEVQDDSPAADAGIKPTDVITKFNGQAVNNALELRRLASATAPGTSVKLEVYRNKKPMDITVKLADRPENTEANNNPSDDNTAKIGMRVQELTPDLAERLKMKPGTTGVVVRTVQPGSPADRAGIEPGNVITKIEGNEIKGVKDFNSAIAKIKSGDTVSVVIRSSTGTSFVDLTLD